MGTHQMTPATAQPYWIYKRKAWPAIHLTGDDRIDFLQRLSTQNFKSYSPHSVVPTAFLNGNGTVVALCMAWIKEDRVTLLAEPQSQSVLLQHMDKLHFAEKIEIQSEPMDWIELRGPQARDVLKSSLKTEIPILNEWPRPVLANQVLPAEPWNGPGWLIPSDLPLSDVRVLNENEYYGLRAFYLFPRDQVDVGENNIILEADLLDYVHRNKGCYPGQEVVERIFTYGNVAKRLVLLEGHARELEKGSELFINEKRVGHVTSRHMGSGENHYCVATVFRLQALVGNVFSLGAGQTPQLKVLKVAGEKS
jgi:folate-binding protein YgfZ